jgi:hypothetical protein
VNSFIGLFGSYLQSAVDFGIVANNTAPYLYLVAVLAILYSYSKYIVRFLSKNNNTKSSSFISYQFVFSLILLQCLYLVFLVEGAKQQVGVIVWIIYVSALMVLFLIFLALTIAESFFSTPIDSRTVQSKYQFDSSTTGNLSIMSSSIEVIFFCIALTIFSYFTAYELNSIHNESVIELSMLNDAYSYNTSTTAGSSLIDSTPIFNTIKRDISNSLAHYALSGLLQAATLIVVVLGLIH